MGVIKQLLITYLVLVTITFVAAERLRLATAYWDATHKAVLLKDGVLEKEGDAYGFFNDSLSNTGWGVLELRAGYGKTQERDDVTYFLAGYLEGFLTAEKMYDNYNNLYPQLIKDSKTLMVVKDFMNKQDNWTRQQVKLNKADPIWQHAGFLVAQTDGLQAGVAHWAKSQGKTPLSLFAVQFLNAVGDLLDLIPALVHGPKLSLGDYRQPPMGHCSALIKMLPGFENLLFAHSSWYTYAATLRIYKHWDFNVQEASTATGKMSFSSYPGFLVSLDDFYLLGSGLIMTQTTNNVFNATLFSLIKPNTLFAWQRVRLAHALAHTGEEWATLFSKHNSGTYNNQYMIVDTSKVTLGEQIEDWALTVVEQIPGLVEYSDQTQALRRGYWPSYNVPFHAEVYARSGYREMWEKHGADFSYDLCPRAKIFRRDQAGVTDLDSLKHIMRYNDYKNDPYSKGNPCKTICCRNDLQESKPSPGGCYDTKVTDFGRAKKLIAEAVNGPTTQGGLPPFSWDRFNSTMHQGLPPVYNFTFVTMQPVLFTP
ncbi:phospholipase B-like 1 [Alosa sapidissima]|uniref:phospholipase B-like 1 n=1 Tax=Alosa sapidissima TaxID=34773 RepID=UPI001C0A5695|nr:phospholipase B-like 1 [Alosa sapidissima]